MKQRFKLNLIFLFLAVFILFNFSFVGLAFAQTPLVPCTDNCTTTDFFALIQRIVNYFVFTLAVPVATIAIAYAGITMASHPAEEGKRTQAKEIIQAAVIGLVLVLGAWLIVTTIFNYLIKDDVRNKIDTQTGVLSN